MEDTPKVSVIVPVYNVEQYLRECLDSIISQTFSDWECILVDDGSKDNSGRICDEYELKDNRFRVIHQQNAGVSSARNVGLDNARCDWIVFIDSDDWIDNNYIELLYDTAIKTDSDMVVCSFVMQKRKNGWDVNSEIIEENVTFDTKGLDVLTLSREDFLKEFPKIRTMRINSFLHSPWIHIHRKIENVQIRFDSSIKFGEDYLFNLEYYSRIQKISFIPNCSYHYRFVPSSATKTTDTLTIDNQVVLYNATQLFFNRYLPVSEISYYYVFKRQEFKSLLNRVIKQTLYDKKSISVLNYLIKIINTEVSMKEIFVKPFKIKEIFPLLLNKLHLTKVLYVQIVKFWMLIKKRTK